MAVAFLAAGFASVLTAGVSVGLAGALAQGLFRNPLADPYLLGSASGASLGVAVALSLGLWGSASFADMSEAMQWAMRLGLTGMAFVGAWAAVLLTLLLAKGVEHTLRFGGAHLFADFGIPPNFACDAVFFAGQHQHVEWTGLCVDGHRVVVICGAVVDFQPVVGRLAFG